MRSIPILLALSVLAFSNAALCQSRTVVSPVVAASTEGSTNNSFPFNSPIVRRYQQIHGDLGIAPKLITRLSFRMDAGQMNLTGTRAIDLEMFMGHSRPVSEASFFFVRNYIGAPVTTIARKIVNMGPQGQAISPGPNPFTSNMDLVLDAPFLHAGSLTLVWEVVIHANTGVGTFAPEDAEVSSTTPATITITGTGCTATGRTAPMVHQPSYTDRAGILLINFQVTNGPSSAQTLLSVGRRSPNASIPGLCSNLYTDVVLLLLIGTTDTAGAITADLAGSATFVLQNALAGTTLHTQAHAFDTGRPDPLQISNSDGRSGVVPAVNAVRVVDVCRIFNNTGGTTAVEGIFFATSTIGHGLVTQFTY